VQQNEKTEKRQQKATICNKTIVDYQPFNNKKNENNTITIKNYQHIK